MVPIYVISLSNDLERREKISDTFNRLNLKFEFIDAVYGKYLTEDQISHLGINEYFLRKNKKPLPGELGCTLSHQIAYQKIKDNPDCEWAYIFEDDAIINGSFSIFFEALSNCISSKVVSERSLLILGGQDGLWTKDFIVNSRHNQINAGGFVLNKTIKSSQYIYRTCSYVISKNTACNLIELFSHEFFVADEWDYFSKLNLFDDIYYIDLIKHPIDLSTSHIESDRINRDKEFVVRKSLFSRFKSFFKLWAIKMFFLKWLRRFIFIFD